MIFAYFYIFYTQMKKSIFNFGILAVCILCLSACGNKKDFNMSFEEALEIASQSSIQDVMSNADNAEQSLDVAWSYNKDDTKVDAKLISKSKQNLKDIQSESNISVDLKIQKEENNLDIKWDLDIKFVPSAIYLNLSSLNIKWDETTEWITWLVEWYLNKWFSIPLDETIDLNSLNMKDQFKLSSKIKEVINNEWSQVYNGKFTDYNGYNAWKISIDEQKLIEILKDLNNSPDNIAEEIENEIISTNEEVEEPTSEEVVSEEATPENIENSETNPENIEENAANDENNGTVIEDIDLESNDVKIENFEWYLVIIWKDKVALAIENMDIIENEVSTNLNGIFSEKDVLLNISSEWEEVITLSAKRKGSHFNVILNLVDLGSVEWTITPKVSSSKIDIDFDLKLTIKSGEESTVIPLKWNWSYAPISEYKVEIPSEAQDLTEMLWWMVWGLYEWGDDTNYDDYYADYELDTEELNEEATDNLEENTNDETIENEVEPTAE